MKWKYCCCLLKILVSVSPTLYYACQFTQGVISIILGSYDKCIYIYIYLHVIEVCLKAMIAMFYLKSPSNIMKNFFNSVAIYSWKKIFSFSINNRRKCFARKINLYLFTVVKNDQIFSSKVCHFNCDLTLFRRERGTLEVARTYD